LLPDQNSYDHAPQGPVLGFLIRYMGANWGKRTGKVEKAHTKAQSRKGEQVPL
jgi:hypothetical protein